MPHWLIIPFLFLFGSCIGSFLNVVVWRLPRGKSLLWPPSACPKCNHALAWYDNIPVLGWILLRGRCRYCKEPVSARYPIVEAITGLLFVFYYAAFFIWQLGPSIAVPDSFGIPEYITLTSIDQDWAVYGLMMLLVSALLAVSLIDAELYIIPIEVPWVVAGIAFVVHALIAGPSQVGSLSVGPAIAAFTAGSTIGLGISFLLLLTRIIPRSFPDGEPLLDFERAQMEQELRDRGATAAEFAELPPVATKSRIRREMAWEALFVAIPSILGLACMVIALRSATLGTLWSDLLSQHTWLVGLLASVFGALVAAGMIWFTRIIATLILGRVAMGQGDTHLMVAIGAVLGAGPAIVVFFIAPFCGLVIGIYKWMSKGARELPYGPYLSLASAVVIVAYRYVADYFGPHIQVLGDVVREWLRN